MDYPDRILAIYIRDVSQPKRDMAVQTIISSLAVRSVPMFLVPDTLTAAQHAAANGWITADSLSEINQ
jgi:phosphatidate phosphatase APP1